MNNSNKKYYNRIILNDKEYHNPSFQYNLKNSLNYQDCLRMNKDNFIKIKKSKCKVAYYDKTILSNITELSFDQLNKILSMKSHKVNNSNSSNCQSQNNFSSVKFDSDFESGNLLLALEQSSTEYDLVIRHELNLNSIYNWFFFKVVINSDDIQSGTMIKFNIINYTKDKVLFNSTVPILCYYNNQWTRETFNINYYINNYKSDINLNSNIDNNNNNNSTATPNINNTSSSYSTLSFCFEYHQSNDNEYYFSYCYPYTYSQLEQYCYSLSKQIQSNIIRFGSIGKTIQNNKLHLIVISDFNDSSKEINNRPSIILTSRVHPGESNSSYVIQGVIDFLTQSTPESVMLRKMFIWKIIPMLNPDGVINGNYRMNLSGRDLNRAWIDGNITSSPSIYYMKELIKNTLNSRKIHLYCDFHGHSKKSNFFLYSCRKEDNAFNINYHSINSNLDILQCVYRIMPAKNKTARAILYREFKVDSSFCLESSVASFTVTKDKDKEIYRGSTINDYKQIGIDFCLNVLQINKRHIIVNKSIKTIEAFSHNDNKHNDGIEEKKRMSNTSSSKTLFPKINLNYTTTNAIRPSSNINTCPGSNNKLNHTYIKQSTISHRQKETLKPVLCAIKKSP